MTTAGKKRQRRAALTIKGKAYIAGIYEHPTRHAPDKSTAQLHAEVAKGALEDVGLTKGDIDGYFCAGDAPGGGSDRGRALLGRADHARRQAAHRRLTAASERRGSRFRGGLRRHHPQRL